MRVEQVFIAPLASLDTYGAEVEVSDFVKIDGLSKIKRSIDSTDYSVGIYRFDDLKLKCNNSRGAFNENDSRSVFSFTRDKAKVRVVVQEINSETLAIVTQTQFEGLLNDEATRLNLSDDTISLTALSKDSVLRTENVPAGSIAVGSTAKTALVSILSQPAILQVLTVDPADINPEYNFIIDTPAELDGLKVKDALDLILKASSSVLLLQSDAIIIQGRNVEPGGDVLELKGRGEITNNANIISITAYNSGKQRQFNSIRLNDGDVTVSDDNSISEYGVRQIEFDFPMVNNIATLQAIGRNIADEFRYPKLELKVKAPTEFTEDFDLMDLARIDAPWLKKPKVGKFLPVYGVAKFGETITPYPERFGSVQIPANIKFKIISIEDDPKGFVTTLKLRQFGKFFNDGVF
jgi:hypothetical protein